MTTGWALALLLAAPGASAMATATARPTIAIAPVGAVSAERLRPILPMVESAFGATVVVVDPIALPEGALEPRRGQYLSTAILDALAPLRRREWDRLLGVADVDLYVPDLNFVFGEADARRGVAVFSLSRLRAGAGGDGEALLLRRAATEAIHELGHTYGLGHCRDPRCVMWFSNTLAESDRKGTAFCPAHAAQLAAALAR